MKNLGLSYEEFQEILRACYWLVIDRCPPNFDFRAFLVGRLTPKLSEIGAKIEQLTDEQINLLCQQVMEHQRLIR